MRVDLHIHSNNSDGSESVETIIDMAKRKGIDAIAITDHDNVNGLARAHEYAVDKVQLISGIELSTYDEIEIHMLGYGIDYTSDIIVNKTAELVEQRKERIRKILSRLRDERVYIDDEEIDYSCAGRLQIARLMLSKGYVTCINEAFQRYLGPEGSAYIPSARLHPIEAIDIVTSAGGTPVLAHPEKYLRAGRLEGMLDTYMEHGLGGLECNYPSHSHSVTVKLRALARERHLIETVGSDYHGTNGVNELGQVRVKMSEEDIALLSSTHRV